jgi:hypothetical protein
MTLKDLINASGGPARCASIWGVTRESVSRMIKRNSISRGLIEELVEYHIKEIDILTGVYNNESEIDFVITDRVPPRSKK